MDFDTFKPQAMFEDITLNAENFDLRSQEISHQIFDCFEFFSRQQENMNDQSKQPVLESTNENVFIEKTELEKNSQYKNYVTKNKTIAKNKISSINKESKTDKIKYLKRESKNNSKKDYKKNICGYATKRIIKQALGDQYRSIIEGLCLDLKADKDYFYKVYITHNLQNITGPTHLFYLMNPKLKVQEQQLNIKEIRVRQVFASFFNWFIRHRYVRYLLTDGKMTFKEKYINYKNKEMMYLITSQWSDILKRIEDKLKISNSQIQNINRNLQKCYFKLVQKNSLDLPPKQKSLPTFYVEKKQTLLRQETKIEE